MKSGTAAASENHRRPFESLEQEAFLSVVRTAAVLTDAFERMLKEVGVSFAQYNVLLCFQVP